jgi:ATP-dependent helicase/nuclease subunit A
MERLTGHQQAALDYSRHISLTANAGSGKTFVLSRRYLEIALNEDIPLRNIAAITFTDKAASELYKKIADVVDKKLAVETEGVPINKLQRIRRQLVSANISTIHSFCIDILREFPVEADLDANFNPIDVIVSDELIELSIEEVIKNALKGGGISETVKYLIRVFSSKRLLTREIFRMISVHRKNVIAVSKRIYNSSEDEVAKHFNSLFWKYAAEILSPAEKLIIPAVEKVNEAVITRTNNNSLALQIDDILTELESIKIDTQAYLAELKKLGELLLTRSEGKVKKKDYLGDKDSRAKLFEEIFLIEKFFQEIKEIAYPEDAAKVELELAHFGKQMLALFNEALELYEEKKRENSYLDYEDILLHTQLILENENVRSALNEKYKYIMIDEYQDTNELQYRIFIPIVDYLRKNNLFVVGDEKQSIYMFRDAELEVFDKTKNDIKEASGPGSLLILPDTFRMSPEICLFTNVIFKRLFANPNKLYNEVEYSEIVCARSDNKQSRIELLIAEEENGNSIHAEAALVSKRILKLLTEHTNKESLSWSDIAILCRKRKNFSELEKAFTKFKIPYSILGGKGFYQRQSVYDIYNYFAFLLEPANDSALVGILRSPFFSISDSTLFEVSLSEGLNFWEKVKKNSNSNLYSAVSFLSENIKIANNTEIPVLMRKILSETGFLSVIASKPNGEQELANIYKLVKVAIRFGSQGYKTLYDFVTYLRESIKEIEDEAQAAIADESNSVKIMTLHQAKGLEYKAVFLYKCSETSPPNSIRSKQIAIDKQMGILTKVPIEGNYFSDYHDAPVNKLYNFIHKKKNFAELKRLFYVGVTRAIDFLFISTVWQKEGKFNNNSFMGLLQSAQPFDISMPYIEINAELRFLRKTDSGFENSTEELNLRVPIVTEIEENLPTGQIEHGAQFGKSVNIAPVTDEVEGEIISATKIAVFNQCAIKYKLTYELGAASLISGNVLNYEFNPSESENESQDELIGKRNLFSSSALKGKAVHKILQKELTAEQAEKFLSNYLKEEISLTDFDKNSVDDLKEEILSDLKKFVDSKAYKELKSYSSFKNEYELYAKEKNYYLYGIIDKLIFDGERLIIVDYKTDNITPEKLEERALSYFIQLKFYSYIAIQKFESVESIELRLIFIKHPEHIYRENIQKDHIAEFGDEITRIVLAIREKNYSKNLNHCKNCIFAVNDGNCIIS